MATNGSKINFQVGFSVDKSGLSQMQSLFQQIAFKAQEPANKMNVGLQQAAKTATTLDAILTKTFNTELGTLNVTKFNQELAKSGLSLKKIQSDFSNIGYQGTSAYNRLSQAVLRTNLQIKESNKMLDQMFTTFKNTIRYGISSSVFNNMANSVQRAFDYSKQLDTSLNDIRIVTDKSAESMTEFAKQANEASKGMGASTLDYTNAALIYYQQGLSDAEVQARAETTIKAANVTGQTGEEVSEQLTAVWNGYKVSAAETEAYVDKLAAVAATTAADLEELSVGMSKVASAANAMGVDFDDLNAQIATIVSVTRQAPESVGTALKTIYARLGDLKVDGGVDEFGVTLGDVSEQLNAMGIQILKDNGDLRDMSSVIAEVAEKWGTWTQAQRQAAAVAMAGKRQYNNLIALFDNWDMYTDALNTSTDALGTLQQQQDIYMESTAAKLKTLKAAWQGLYDDAINEDEVNAGIEALTNLVEVLDNFIASFGGGIKSIAAFGAIVANIFNKQISDSINTAYQNFLKYQNNITALNAKKDILNSEMSLSSGENKRDVAIEAGLNKELIIATQVEEVRRGMTQEVYNELMTTQGEVGKLVEQKSLLEQNAQIKANELQEINQEYYTSENINQILKETVDLTELKKDKEADIIAKLEDEKNTYLQLSQQINQAGKSQDKLADKIINIRTALKEAGYSIQQINHYMSPNIKSQDKFNEKVIELKAHVKNVLDENKKLTQEHNKVFDILQSIIESKNKMYEIDESIANKEQEISEKIAAASTNLDISKAVTSITSSLSSLAMTWGMVNSLFDTWTDKASSFGDKINQTFISLGFIIPNTIITFKKLNDSFNLLNASIETSTLLEKQNSNQALLSTLSHIRLQQGITKEGVERAILVKELSTEEKERVLLLATQALGIAADDAEAKKQLENLTVQELFNKVLEKQIGLRKQILKSKLSDALSLLKSKTGIAAIGIAAVTAAIALGIKFYNNYIEKIRENNEEIIKNAKEIEEQIKAHEDLYNSYNKLFKQYEKDNKITNELYDAALKLAEAYDIQGGRVLALSGYYDILGQKAEEARIKELGTKITTAESAAQSAGENAILDAKKGSRGFKFGDTYTFGSSLYDTSVEMGNIQRSAIEYAGLSEDVNNIFGHFSHKIDYTDPKAVKAWMDQVDKMVEYYDKNIDEEIRKSDDFYQNLLKEQQELAKNRTELIDQLTLQYSGMIEKAIFEQKNLSDGIQLTEKTTALELMQLKEKLKDSLDIPEEDFNEIFKNILKQIDDIGDAYNKLEIAEQINEQLNKGSQKGLEEVINQIKNFNNEQLAFLEVHLNTAILSNDLRKWIDDNQDVLNALNYYGTSNDFKNILSNYDEKEGFTEEQKTSLYDNDSMKSYLPSEEAFNTMDEGDQLNTVTLAWIESTKAVVEHKKEALDALNEEEKATKKLLDAKAKEAEENENKISAEIEGNEKLKDKLFEIIALSQKLTDEDAELSKEEKQLLKDVESKTNLNKDDLKIYGETQNEVDKLQDAYDDYGSMIDEITNLTENHTDNIEKLNQVLDKQNSVMDSIQSNYKSLMDITDSYNKTHAFTIDNVQQLIAMDNQYVAALQLEGNQLSINEQYFQALTIAKIDDLEQTAVLTAQEELEALAEEKVTDASLSATSAILNAAAAARDASEAAKEGAAAWDAYAASMRAAAGVSGSQYDAKAKEITDALRVRLLAAESAKSQVGKGGSAMRSAMGASSKSGGSSKDKKDKELKKLEDEFDRYWEINKALDAIDRNLKKIDKDQENLYGRELINSLKQENELLSNQAQLYEQLYAAQQQEAAELRSQLSGMGVSFDESSGAILNYAEAVAAALATYNAAVTTFNNGPQDEAAQKSLEAAEKAYENFKKLIERYDKLVYDEMQDTQEKLDDIWRKQLANNLKAWEVEVQLKLDWKQLERDWNDFIKEVTTDFKKVFKDLRVEGKNMLDDAKTYIGEEGTINTIINAVHDVTGEIDKIRSGQGSSMFESISQAQEKLKELNEQLLDSSQALHDLWEEAWDNYLEGIDQVSDAFDKLIDRFERINDELEFQGKLIELLYGDEAYKLMSKLYEGQQRNTEVQIQSLKTQVDMWKDLFNASGATMDNQMDWTADQEKYYEQWMEAQSELNDLVIEYIELLKKDYLNTVSDTLQELEKFISGSSLSDIADEWEKISADADKYYDSVEGAYYIQTLANKIDESIAKSSNLKAQQRLMKLREKEIDYLREKENLTEYDLKAAEMRYQIALKEIALEQAQQNKTSMKLTRNEQGNWTYQYIADEEDVATKRQELLDAYNNLYQLASDAYEANLEALQELQEKYLESAKAIAEDDTLTNEEKEQKLLELREWYLEQYALLSEENQLYRNDLAASGAGLLLEIYKQDEEAYESMTENERELVDALINANINDYEELDDVIKGNYDDLGDKARETYQEIQSKAREVMADTRRDWTSGAQTIADLWNKDGGSSVKTQVTKAYEQIEKANEKYKERVDWCAEAVERDFSEEGIVGAIQAAENETDSLRDKTVEMVETAIPYLQALKDYVDEIERAWESVQQAIMDAINLIQEYLRMMSEAQAAAEQQAQAAAAQQAAQQAAVQTAKDTGTKGSTGNNATGTPSYYTDPYGVSGTRMIIDANGNKTIVGGYTSTTAPKYDAVEFKNISAGSNHVHGGSSGTFGGSTTYVSSSGHVHGGSSGSLDDIKKYTGSTGHFATGGYTGSWGDSSGKLAILHQKELVLNADDTKNFLAGINTVRELSSGVNGPIQDAVLKAVARTALELGNIQSGTVIGGATNNSTTDNVFNITAEFPNANSVDEIREAILSLPNIASQHVNSKLR